MNILVKIGLYLAVVGVTALFAWMGYQESQAILAQPNRFDSELTSVQGGPAPDAQKPDGKGQDSSSVVSTNTPVGDASLNDGKSASEASGNINPAGSTRMGSQSKMIQWFLLAALGLIATAFLIARDVAVFSAEKAVEFVYNLEGETTKSESYEAAEQACSEGRYLDAIELMKAYFAANPRDVFAARRVAEIYEKDLQNFSAAAMEYEDILRLPLPAVRWSWMAIHLCNIYTGKLNNQDRALELLQQIVIEHSQTPAGKKARERLEMLGYEIEIVDEPDAAPESGSGAMPKGFKPRS